MRGLPYVILRHEGVEMPHFDWMFQADPAGELATWRSAVWPPAGEVVLERLADHRKAYLTFEGEISGGRGSVRRVAQGLCEVEQGEGFWKLKLHPVPVGPSVSFSIIRGSSGQWHCVSEEKNDEHRGTEAQR